MEDWLSDILLGAGFMIVSFGFLYEGSNISTVGFAILAVAHVIRGLWKHER